MQLWSGTRSRFFFLFLYLLEQLLPLGLLLPDDMPLSANVICFYSPSVALVLGSLLAIALVLIVMDLKQLVVLVALLVLLVLGLVLEVLVMHVVEQVGLLAVLVLLLVHVVHAVLLVLSCSMSSLVLDGFYWSSN